VCRQSLHHTLCPVTQDLVAEVPAAKELFDKAADILGYDLLKV
jgi:[acyl-carrier-protein] S-malonyltransferase